MNCQNLSDELGIADLHSCVPCRNVKQIPGNLKTRNPSAHKRSLDKQISIWKQREYEMEKKVYDQKMKVTNDLHVESVPKKTIGREDGEVIVKNPSWISGGRCSYVNPLIMFSLRLSKP